jgi:hypothetical protein
MEASLCPIAQHHRALDLALELLGLRAVAAPVGLDDEATRPAAGRRTSPATVTINAHGMRVDARTAGTAVWLDIVPEDRRSGLPQVTVFLDVANVATLRRQLDAIALALLAVEGHGESARQSTPAASGAPAADREARANEEI